MPATDHSFQAAKGLRCRVCGRNKLGFMIQLGHTRKAVIHQVESFDQLIINYNVIHRITPFRQHRLKIDLAPVNIADLASHNHPNST